MKPKIKNNDSTKIPPKLIFNLDLHIKIENREKSAFTCTQTFLFLFNFCIYRLDFITQHPHLSGRGYLSLKGLTVNKNDG